MTPEFNGYECYNCGEVEQTFSDFNEYCTACGSDDIVDVILTECLNDDCEERNHDWGSDWHVDYA